MSFILLVMATFQNLAISLLYIVGVTMITCTLQVISHGGTRMLRYLPL